MRPSRSGWPVVALLFLAPSSMSAQPAVAPAEPYAKLTGVLERFIERQVAEKHLPALSIALVDDQRVVWAQGFGFADPATRRPATAETVYRVGSVSKLFTDIAVMQLVEQGKLDLDAPVTKYLPGFKPRNPSGKPITLRQMMAHRSGLVREPPVGNYFDPSEPTLAKTIESLNQTTLVLEPGSKTKYSNAAIAGVGYTLQTVTGQPFSDWVLEKVLQPLGMKQSSFTVTPAVRDNLAKAVMWSYHGREFPAPTFELGEAPAGCMYSTVIDLARFLSVLFNDARSESGPVLRAESLREMLTPQFAAKGEKTGFGLGFSLGQLDGRKRVGHGGAIYGFATDLAFVPEEKLGVVVIASRDIANPVVSRIADTALRFMLANRQSKPLPEPETSEPLAADDVRRFTGRFVPGEGSKATAFDLVETVQGLRSWPVKGGLLVEMRRSPKGLVTDGLLGFGTHLDREGDRYVVRDVGPVSRTEDGPFAPRPPAGPPRQFFGLIGEYGWDHNTLFIFEKDGGLHALIEWVFDYPLTQQSEDVYAFPDFGLYHDEKLIFRRDRDGKATEVEAASVVFKRRPLDGEDGRTFRIRPELPIDELRKEATQTKPPTELGSFRDPDLVDLTALDPTIKLDLRYATDNNFLSTPLYPSAAKAYLQKPAAAALVRVHRALEKDGYGLLIHDAYRPWHVTKMFWEATPKKFRHFVADPSKGSRHNRGCAVDLTLYERETGKPVEMVSGFDEFSDRAYPDYIGGTSRQRWHRDLLRRHMSVEGFTVYEAEWWHFDFKDWKQYGILNRSFEELDKTR